MWPWVPTELAATSVLIRKRKYNSLRGQSNLLRLLCTTYILVIAWGQVLYVKYWHQARGPGPKDSTPILWHIANLISDHMLMNYYKQAYQNNILISIINTVKSIGVQHNWTIFKHNSWRPKLASFPGSHAAWAFSMGLQHQGQTCGRHDMTGCGNSSCKNSTTVFLGWQIPDSFVPIVALGSRFRRVEQLWRF